MPRHTLIDVDVQTVYLFIYLFYFDIITFRPKQEHQHCFASVHLRISIHLIVVETKRWSSARTAAFEASLLLLIIFAGSVKPSYMEGEVFVATIFDTHTG